MYTENLNIRGTCIMYSSIYLFICLCTCTCLHVDRYCIQVYRYRCVHGTPYIHVVCHVCVWYTTTTTNHKITAVQCVHTITLTITKITILFVLTFICIILLHVYTFPTTFPCTIIWHPMMYNRHGKRFFRVLSQLWHRRLFCF